VAGSGMRDCLTDVDALLSLIAEKTGLQLYDLRDVG
jgi:hypothetical protein